MVWEPSMRKTGLLHPLWLDGTSGTSSLGSRRYESGTPARELDTTEALDGAEAFSHASTTDRHSRRAHLEELEPFDTATEKQD